MFTKKLKTTLSVLAAAALTLTTLPAHADAGGGDTGGGGGEAESVGGQWSVFYDDRNNGGTPVQGVMRDSIDYFVSGTITNGHSLAAEETSPKLRSSIYDSCTGALEKAEARNPNGPDGKSRVVALFWGSKNETEMFRGYSEIAWGTIEQLYNQWVDGGRAGILPHTSFSSTDTYNQYTAAIQRGFNDIMAVRDTGADNPFAACIALNSNEPPSSYNLTITTDTAATFHMAGGTESVADTIHADNGGSPIIENLQATITLHWDGVENNPAKAEKTVTITNRGDTTSPAFTPADFGWDTWPAGSFWFDVTVTKQGHMSSAIDTPDRDSRESWDADPVPPSKTLYKTGGDTPLPETDTLASAQAYDAKVTAYSNGYTTLKIFDIISTADVWIGANNKDDASNVTVTAPDGNTVDAEISIDRETQGQVTVTATITEATIGEYVLSVPTYAKPTMKDYTIPDTSKACFGPDFATCLDGNSEQTSKITPTPDKVWVLNELGGLTYADPDWTNAVAADQKLFLHGDTVGAVVNGHIKPHLTADLDRYVLVDDWSKAATYVDFTDATKAKVYVDGKDVTDQFTITVDGTTTVATAKKAFLDTTGGLDTGKDVKLVLTGEFYPVSEKTDTDGILVTLYNSGSETYNNETMPTNEPPVFVWNPDPSKDVLSSADQGGDQSSINGQMVFPGQKIEYLVNVDVAFPDPQLAYDVKNFQVRDSYDPLFILDKASVEFYDARTNKTIPRSNYTLEFDDNTSTFTAAFTQDWIDSQLSLDEPGDLLLRFDGVVKNTAVEGSVIENQAWEIINNSVTPTNIPVVSIPKITPDKEDLNEDLQNIDGKTVVGGETIMYRITLDARPGRDKIAYDVHKLGILDDYDEEYVAVDPARVKVVEKTTGADVTEKFTVQVDGGKMAVFAKQVDSVNVNGETVLGDPQPADLFAYADSPIDPLVTPIIDQSLLGREYWVYMPATVVKVTDGYVIKNQAFENFENMVKATRIVSNPEKEITPDKDVTVDVAGDSIDGGEVVLNGLFNYRLASSVLPADRAVKAKNWSIVDDYDETADRFTGNWVAVADRDLYDGEALVAKAGEQIDGATVVDAAAVDEFKDLTIHDIELTDELAAALGEHSYGETGVTTSWNSRKVFTQGEQGEDGYGFFLQVTAGYNNPDAEVAASSTGAVRIPDEDVIRAYANLQLGVNENTETGLFTVTEKDGVITVTAQQSYLDLVNTRMDKEQAFSIYVQMERLIPGTVTNTFTETYNNVDRDPQPVETTTPEHPAIDIEKWDTASGAEDGDRDEASQALQFGAGEDVNITYTVTNTGDVPLKNVKVTDTTTRGSGVVSDPVCGSALDDGLDVGETVTCTAVLTGVQGFHTNKATVTGESVYSGDEVTDSDTWNGTTPLPATGSRLEWLVLVAVSLMLLGVWLVSETHSRLTRRQQ